MSRNSQNLLFETGYLVDDIKARAIQGGTFSFAFQGISFAVNLGCTAILARLLSPEDFGLVAMVSSIIGFLVMFKDAGLSLATVQQDRITHHQISTLFWINVGLSVLLTTIVSIISPMVAWFYSEPRLTLVTIALGIGFIFSGLSIQHQALLRRSMRFRLLVVIQFISLLAGNGVAILTAIFGWHYWALIIRSLVNTVVFMLGSWLAVPWRPGLAKRNSGTRKMLKFGGYLTADRLLIYLARNIDKILIGKFLGPNEAGIYTKSYSLLLLPLSQLRTPANAIVIPVLSRLQKRPAQFRRSVLQASRLLAFVLMPVSASLFLFSREIILVVLGPEWKAAIPVLRWLAPAAICPSVTFVVGWQLTALGKVKRSFQWNLIYVFISVIGIVIGLQWGLIGVAISTTLISFTTFFPCLWFCLHDVPVDWKMLLQNLRNPFVSMIFSALFVWLILVWLTPEWNVIFTLVIGFISYILLFLSIYYALPNGRDDLQLVLRVLNQGLFQNTGRANDASL